LRIADFIFPGLHLHLLSLRADWATPRSDCTHDAFAFQRQHLLIPATRAKKAHNFRLDAQTLAIPSWNQPHASV
jgi:hypothetical protein